MTPENETAIRDICGRVRNLKIARVYADGKRIVAEIADYPHDNMTLSINTAREAARSGYGVSHSNMIGKAGALCFVSL